MKRLHYARMALAALALVMAAGCETPTSNSLEHRREATAHNRDLMLGKRDAAAQSQAMQGPTASGVIVNYHENQEVGRQSQVLHNQGLVKLD